MPTTSHGVDPIALCYFAFQGSDYVPLDLGFTAACMRRAGTPFPVELVPLTYRYRTSDEEIGEDVARDCSRILASRPRAVILAIENVLWSKVFALGRAKKIASELRWRDPRVFVGIQSYKIQPAQVRDLFERGLADFVVLGNPELALQQVADVVGRKAVPGVVFPGDAPRSSDAEPGPLALEGDLEALPSPYLGQVFDGFLREQQAAREGGFRAFLASSRGCGFGCFYCFRSVKFDRVRLFSVQRFFDEMEYLLDRFGVRSFFVLDDAFLYSKERLRAFAAEFRERKARRPDLGSVRLHMMARPESIDEDVVGLLAELQTGWVQIGLQTVHPDLQHYMRRGVGVDHFRSISAWLEERKIGLLLDVILGLPGDSIQAFKETLAYALSLKPISLQVKQFYLNPNTRFFVEREKYGIELETSERDFDAPYVVRAAGLDDAYFEVGTDFVMQQIEANPQVWWKFLSQRKWFVTQRKHPR